MTNSSNEPDGTQENATQERSDSENASDVEPTGEPGYIGDEELPEDLQPTDDNPLAKAPDPDDVEDGENSTA